MTNILDWDEQVFLSLRYLLKLGEILDTLTSNVHGQIKLFIILLLEITGFPSSL